jgi:hypothetical protein
VALTSVDDDPGEQPGEGVGDQVPAGVGVAADVAAVVGEGGDELDGLVQGTEPEGGQHGDRHQRPSPGDRVHVSHEQLPDELGADEGPESVTEVVVLQQLRPGGGVVEDVVTHPHQPAGQVQDRRGGGRERDRRRERPRADHEHQGRQARDRDEVLERAGDPVDDPVGGEADEGRPDDRQGGPLVACERRAAPPQDREGKALVDDSVGVPAGHDGCLTMHADHADGTRRPNP